MACEGAKPVVAIYSTFLQRGVDPELPRTAIEVATRLVIDIAGGTPGPTTEAVLPEHLPQPASIPLRRARLARVLGLEVADAEVERILRALGLGVAAHADGWTVTAPTRGSEEHQTELTYHKGNTT